MPPSGVVFARCCALEREDRLLFIADSENRALPRPTHPEAGAEFRYQPLDDVPLLLAGVLRFVDQYVIESEIELVVHPIRIAFGQQPMGLVDQIVVIEEAPAFLLIGVTPDDLDRDSDERRRPVAADNAVASLDETDDSLLFGAEPFSEFRIASGETRRNQPLSRFFVFSQKDADIMLDSFLVRCCQCRR